MQQLMTERQQLMAERQQVVAEREKYQHLKQKYAQKSAMLKEVGGQAIRAGCSPSSAASTAYRVSYLQYSLDSAHAWWAAALPAMDKQCKPVKEQIGMIPSKVAVQLGAHAAICRGCTLALL